MTIPTGVNYLEFWKLAKPKGIKIQSRFLGVTFNMNGKFPKWLVRIQGKDKLLSKRFPFTESGEAQAGEFYRFHAGDVERIHTFIKKKAKYRPKT